MMEEDTLCREGTVMWNEDLEDELIADMMSHLDSTPVRELLASTMGNPTPEQLDRVCTDYQTNPSYHLLGYQRKGVIIGCIGLQLSFPGSAIIRAIAIAPTYRGQGIGSRLLWQSIETFSLTHLVVETDRDAVEFYRMCRFTISSLGEKYPATERFLCSWTV
jgi:N-acetylglutamate synthase-like GNAT family acetyltransferase